MTMNVDALMTMDGCVDDYSRRGGLGGLLRVDYSEMRKKS